MQLADPWHFARNETAEHYVRLLADAPRRPLAIFGPRQVGKTHFLTHDLAPAAALRGWEPVYIDLWGQPDPLGAACSALETVLRRLALAAGQVGQVGQVGAAASAGPAPTPSAALPSDPSARLAAQFAELIRLQPAKPVLLLLDEAQTLARSVAGEAAMKAIRAIFNSHPGLVLLVLTGSHKAQLNQLVGDHSKTAFKLAAHMDFPVLGAGFVAFMAQRHQAITGRELPGAELEWAFGQLQHRPGEMIDFIRLLITDLPGTDVREALAQFKARNRPDQNLADQYDGCTPLQQAVLLEVAANAKLFSKDTRDRVALRIGQPAPVAPASVHNALAQLEAKGILVKSPQRGHYQFDDELMREWVDQVARQRPRM